MRNLRNLPNAFFSVNLIIVSLISFTLVSCEPGNTNNDTTTAGALALVANNSSTSSSSTSSSCVTTGTCKIFIATPTAPNNAGISGFDTHCNNSPNKPSGSYVYKALISDGIKRRACSTANCSGGTSEHIDWVLKPNQQYKRKDGTTTIGTTNANGIFVTSLTNVIDPDVIDGYTDNVFTGVNANWTPGDDCSDWTGSGDTMTGAYLYSDIRAFAEMSRGCSAMINQVFRGKAICVEQ
ncbi:DUF1554 domain-containing protein [Leptospira noumeaensis]|uniref:DUF1554 domain-containing protein n=1 Tax=Leptospira noumeaensis TaxID=2484964 RepID=A0A4R9I7D5_9LEPT|nr:DUF1554 domain-containing protein [Leptospira noumeaensis]TGK82048.1 DUF1554 domain-containing protein [Leptospira noumeaensis]